MSIIFTDSYREVTHFFRAFERVLDRHSVRTIVELGSRDALTAISLRVFFPNATVYAFECNPPAIERCKKSIGDRTDIILVQKAVSDECGPVDFYAIDPEKTITPWLDGNIGASSLLRAKPGYPYETYVQKQIVVQATTLERWAAGAGIDAIDVLWMDIQGAELKALKGMGELLDTVKAIYTEVTYHEVYFGQPLAREFEQYVMSRGFGLQAMFNTSAWFGNALYIRVQ